MGGGRWTGRQTDGQTETDPYRDGDRHSQRETERESEEERERERMRYIHKNKYLPHLDKTHGIQKVAKRVNLERGYNLMSQIQV